MIKRESHYTRDGEEVWSKVTEYKGRFHDEGYSMYAHGNTICSRKSAPFPKDISKGDLVNMLLLSRHLLLNSNALGYRDKKGNQPMNLTMIGEVIGIKERQAYRFYKRMVSKRMIAKTEAPIKGGTQTQYVVNPLYFFNGKTISDHLYWTFQDQLDLHLSPWVRDTYIKRREDGVI